MISDDCTRRTALTRLLALAAAGASPALLADSPTAAAEMPLPDWRGRLLIITVPDDHPEAPCGPIVLDLTMATDGTAAARLRDDVESPGTPLDPATSRFLADLLRLAASTPDRGLDDAAAAD